MDRSYNFLLNTDLGKKYIGEWAAIVNEEVVAHGKNVEKVYKEAKKKYPSEEPLLNRVHEKIMIV